MERILLIGKFQPFHNGHVSCIEQIMEKGSLPIIGLGSSNKSNTLNNPFTAEQRAEMINLSLQDKQYELYFIPDIGNNDKWVEHVEKCVMGGFDKVFTDSPFTASLFKEKGYAIIAAELRRQVSATQVRELMYCEDRGIIANEFQNWRDLVPEGTKHVLERDNAQKLMQYLYDHQNFNNFKNPLPAVDIIIQYNDRIVLIKRKDGGYAFPGGFVEFGESTETAAVREAKEETNLDVRLERLLGVYSNPNRDPRNHIMSITYVAKGSGDLKSGDDAKEAFVVPIEAALKMELAFDHSNILKDYKGYLDLRENLAALEHEQWAHWTDHMLANSTEENILRWKQQIATSYADLTEKEKNSDREWADKALKLIEVKQ